MKKIAIIGGGFFGCYIARRLKKKNGSLNIDIYDRESKLMSRAATVNQCRLHLGYHYPRSRETIAQTCRGFYNFLDEFHEHIHFPKINLYAVRKDGHVNLQDYLNVMDEFKLEYEICDKNNVPYFHNLSEIEGIIKVGEGVIHIQKLREAMINSVTANVYLNATVNNIDTEDGMIEVDGKIKGPYDYVINTTYVDPNLGLPYEKRIEIKYELTAMVYMEAPFGDEVALTIMDGDYVSLYPCDRHCATLSSVPHTPFCRPGSVNELEDCIKNAEHIARKTEILDKILHHGKQLIKLDDDNCKVKGLWIAPKAKIQNDIGNTRISDIRTHDRLISVLCGKLDATRYISDMVLKYIGF